MDELVIYHDDKEKNLADYIEEYTDIKNWKASGVITTKQVKLPSKNSDKKYFTLPEKLRELLYFTKPDLVICLDDGREPTRPIFVIEKTCAKVAQDHWLQRFNNLVGAAQLGIPGAYITPYDLSNDSTFPGKLDSAFFYAYGRVMEIHNMPIYIAEWETIANNRQNLDCDMDPRFMSQPNHLSRSMANLIKFINLALEFERTGKDISKLMADRLMVDLRGEMNIKAFSSIPQISDFNRLTHNMPGGAPLSKVQFDAYIARLGLTMPTNLPERIGKRNEYVVFTPVIRGTQTKRHSTFVSRLEHGADPYVGQPLAIDYMFCRLGKTPYERDKNLVIDLSFYEFKEFAKAYNTIHSKCPLKETKYTDVKKNLYKYGVITTEGCAQTQNVFWRIYTFAADLIILKDGVLVF